MKIAPSVIVAEENAADASRMVDIIETARPQWRVLTVNNGEHALAYLRGIARFAIQARLPVTTLLLLSMTIPQVTAFQILKWITGQPLLKSLLIAAMCASSDFPDPEESKYSAHTLLRKSYAATQLVDFLTATEQHWAGAAEEPPVLSRVIPLRQISQLRCQLDTTSPPLASDLVLLTNSPPLSA